MLGKLVLVGAMCAVLQAQESPEEVRSGLQDVAILNEKRSHDISGKYDFGFAAEDGTARVEEKTDDGEVRGQYQYVNADGKTVVVKYTAGKNGFVVDSPILPQAPKALPTLPPPPPQPQYQPQYNQQQYSPQPPPFQQQQYRPQPPPFQPPQPQYQPQPQQYRPPPQFAPQQYQQQQQYRPQPQLPPLQIPSLPQQPQYQQPQPQYHQPQSQFSQGPQRFVPQGPPPPPQGPPAARFPAGVDPRACPNFPICPNQ